MNLTMDGKRFTVALQRAGVVFSKPVDAELARLYFDALADLFIGPVEHAIEVHCARGQHFPRPADIRRKCGDSKESETEHRGDQCTARGCPRRATSYFEAVLCSAHSAAPLDRWDEVTDAICRGDERYAVPPAYQVRTRLAYLCESGQYAAMEAVDGERGLRWARAEVKAGRLRPGSYDPSPLAVEATRRWLEATRGSIPEVQQTTENAS